jgi:hypothetical protein
MTSRPLVALAIALGLAAAVLALAAGLRYAESAGMIGAEEARRTMQVLIGLGFAAYANMMPKQLGRMRGTPRAEAWAQRTLRVGGWSMTLGGLAFAGLWAFAPLAIADVASKAVLASATAVTVGHALWCYLVCRGEARSGQPNQ